MCICRHTSLHPLYPKGLLPTILPGLYTTLRIESQIKEQRVLIPQAAVQESQQGTFVLIVGDDNTVSQRFARLGQRYGAMWVVEEGIEAGEKVIVEGLQKVRTGSQVTPTVKTVDPITGAVSAIGEKTEG